jgi:hypothetical protein
MYSINWAFLCDYATIDSSGKISIMGIFEFINAQYLPFRWNQLYLAAQLHLGFNVSVRTSAVLSDPAGNEMLRTPGALSTTDSRYPTSFTTYSFYAFDLTKEGEYRVELFIEDVSVHSVPFGVHLIK